MACDGYSCSALMGNWQDERQAFKQPSRLWPTQREVRADNDIKFVSDTNEIKNLSKISRNHAWNTKAVILDQGYVSKPFF